MQREKQPGRAKLGYDIERRRLLCRRPRLESGPRSTGRGQHCKESDLKAMGSVEGRKLDRFSVASSRPKNRSALESAAAAAVHRRGSVAGHYFDLSWVILVLASWDRPFSSFSALECLFGDVRTECANHLPGASGVSLVDRRSPLVANSRRLQCSGDNQALTERDTRIDGRWVGSW